MVSCSATYCSNVPKKGYRFFRFPSNPERRAEWVKRCNKEDWTPKTGSRLCEVHFEESQFEQHREDNLRKLKPNAIPTIFKGAFSTKNGKSKKNNQNDYHFHPDIIINESEMPCSEFKRCCFCFKETYPSDGILLVLNGEFTQFGLTVKILLTVGSAEISTDYCCRECSSEVLLSFEKMMALNVSAYITSRKKLTNKSLDEILEKGCEECGEMLENIGQYTDHFRNHILEKITENSEDEPESELKLKEENNPLYKDNEGAFVDNKDEINLFKKKDEKLLNDHCYAKESKEKHSSRICHLCGSCLKNKKSYSKHLWLHTKKPDLNVWTIGNDRKIYKKRHTNVEKMDNSLLNCEKCDAMFTHRSLLFYHYFLAHDSYTPKNLCKRRRPWSCSLCEKKFPSFRILRLHAKEEHRGRDVVPFRCEICQRGYCTLKSLRHHIAFKHLQVKEPPHACPHCPRKYLREVNLRNHMTNMHEFRDEQFNNLNFIEEVIGTTTSDIEYSCVEFDEIPDESKDWLIVDEGVLQ